MFVLASRCLFFFFNDTATTEIYTLSLHDALPISIHSPLAGHSVFALRSFRYAGSRKQLGFVVQLDRKSTRLNSSHSQISYAVFCLKKKTTDRRSPRTSSVLRTMCATPKTAALRAQ